MALQILSRTHFKDKIIIGLMNHLKWGVNSTVAGGRVVIPSLTVICNNVDVDCVVFSEALRTAKDKNLTENFLRKHQNSIKSGQRNSLHRKTYEFSFSLPPAQNQGWQSCITRNTTIPRQSQFSYYTGENILGQCSSYYQAKGGLIQSKRHLHTTRPYMENGDKDQKKKGSILPGITEGLGAKGHKMTVLQLEEELFLKSKEKDKETYIGALVEYKKVPNVYRRGEVEFIKSALKHMKAFNVHDDLDAYKELMSIFPREKMKPQNLLQAAFMWFPKHQFTALEVMESMDRNGVLPDEDFGSLLVDIFGLESSVVRKYRRTLYWVPKLMYENPYKLPQKLPSDQVLLAKIALERMCVDLENKVTIFENEDFSETSTPEEAFIASAQSPQQQRLLEEHPADKPVIVEGGFLVWLKNKPVIYFVLKSEDVPEQMNTAEDEEEDDFDLSFTSFFGTKEGGVRPKGIITHSEHIQDDGTIYALAITSSASKPSLISWIDCLQRSNPRLKELAVLFKMRTPEGEIQKAEEVEQSESAVQ